MKILVALCCILALGACGSTGIWKWKRNDAGGDFMDMVKEYGYEVESYDVQTEDGYILKLFRIPRGRESSSTSDKDSSYMNDPGSRPVVFLMHGLMTNSESFIYGGPSESLALNLADAGFDVFLGNSRGTVYGLKHTTLDPQKDAAFWKFCWQEIGTRDLPAMIDKALAVSGQSTLRYIGHNVGNTAFYVMASEKPSYHSKIERQISLGPVAFMKNADNEIINDIKDNLSSKSWIIKNLGMNSFSPVQEVTKDASANCKQNNYAERICQNVCFLVNGYNSNNLNETTINQLISRVPGTVSTREVVHLAQLKKTGRFHKYLEDPDSRDIDDYSLSKVNVPVFLLYTPNDPLSDVEDVDYLGNMLPQVSEKYSFEELTNNMDLLWSNNMQNVIRKIKVALMQRIQIKN